MCAKAQRNVAFFASGGPLDLELRYAGGYFEASGAITCAKLTGNRAVRIRSHFERIIPSQEVVAAEEHSADAEMKRKRRDAVSKKLAEDDAAKKAREIALAEWKAEVEKTHRQSEAWNLEALKEEDAQLATDSDMDPNEAEMHHLPISYCTMGGILHPKHMVFRTLGVC